MTRERDRTVVQQLLHLLDIRGWMRILHVASDETWGLIDLMKSFTFIFKILPGWVM